MDVQIVELVRSARNDMFNPLFPSGMFFFLLFTVYFPPTGKNLLDLVSFFLSRVPLTL